MSSGDTGSSPGKTGVRGRPFAKGNSGRPVGSKNRSTIFARAALESEADALLRKAVELAKGGDVPMLKFLLGRMLPRERLINVNLPQMEFVDDAVEALGQIAQAVSEGQITPGEGASLATLVNSFSKAIDNADLVARIDALEAKLKKVPTP
jgi:hypothetical protein